MTANQSGQTQRNMLGAKVVDRPAQIHCVAQRLRTRCRGAPTSCQRRDVSAKGRIDAFDESGITHAAAASFGPDCLDLRGGALNDAALDTHHAPSHILLDDLCDVDAGPTAQVRAPVRARTVRFAEDRSDHTHIAGQAINAKPHRAAQRTTFAALDQPPNQPLITLGSYFASQPQARRHLHGQRHPDYQAAPAFDAQFITLHLAKFAPLLAQVLLNLLALQTRTSLPSGDGALVQALGEDNGLARAAFGEQLDDSREQRALVVQPIKGRSFILAEGVSADVAAVPFLLLVVNLDVAFAELPSSRTVFNRATYLLRVQARVLSVA